LRKFIANNSLGLYPRISAKTRAFPFIDARHLIWKKYWRNVRNQNGRHFCVQFE